MILVVGATGQLGTAICRRLAATGQPVRAFVRAGSRHEHLRAVHGIELAFGDLRDGASIDAACRDVRSVVATANVVVPEGASSYASVEGDGYASLIAACRRHAVDRFVFMSTPVTPHDAKVPLFRYKRLIEARLAESGLSHTIFRASLFMDDWFAFLGSRIPLRGAEAATLDRRYGFLRAFLGSIDELIEKRGIALAPGSPATRHAFIALDDVAEFVVRALAHDLWRGRTLEIGGPEILSWQQVIDCYAQALGKPIRTMHVPSNVFRALRVAFAPFSESASNIMGLNWLVGYETLYEAAPLAAEVALDLKRAFDFLTSKVASGATTMRNPSVTGSTAQRAP
jgi:uncharacterized protein YbjT (DUF2867 family)